METQFKSEQTKQSSVHTTLFLRDSFYDFVGENGEIVFFDSAKDVLTLLDPELKLQTQLVPTEMKKRFDETVAEYAKVPEDGKRFLGKPSFQEEWEPTSGQLTLQSYWIDYTIKTHPFPAAGMSEQFFSFSDWICFLLFRTNPDIGTPYTRVEVNRILREKDRFPRTISVSIYPKGKRLMAQEDRFSTVSQISQTLTASDRKRIEQATGFMRRFTVVPFDEYQKKIATKKR